MGFPRRRLIPGEELVADLRPHWIALGGPSVVAVVVAVGEILVLRILPGGLARRPLLWLAIAIGALILLRYPVPRTVAWATSHLVVTTERIVHRRGWVARSSIEIPLEAVNDVRFEQGLLERMVGAGDLVIESAGERGRQVFEHVCEPERVRRTIYEQADLKRRRMYRGGRPRSLLGAPSSTTELERLADLRDRGVLTQDEFEAQKRRILGW